MTVPSNNIIHRSTYFAQTQYHALPLQLLYLLCSFLNSSTRSFFHGSIPLSVHPVIIKSALIITSYITQVIVAPPLQSCGWRSLSEYNQNVLAYLLLFLFLVLRIIHVHVHKPRPILYQM